MKSTAIDALAAPSGDGEVLIWPADAALHRLAERNRAARAGHQYTLLNQSAREVVAADRAAPFVIAAGHQPGFLHPGVWAKNAASVVAAGQLGGRADFWIVDSDSVHRSALAWPAEDGRMVRAMSLFAFGTLADHAYESLPARDVAEWKSLLEKIPAAIREETSTAMPAFLGAFLSAGGESARFAERWQAGMVAVEAAAGMASPQYRRVSDEFDVCRDDAVRQAKLFVAHLIHQGPEVAAAYNDALASYRLRRGIAGRQHPIPDLHVDGSRVELPLWAVRSGEPRQRVHAEYNASGDVTLLAGETRMGTVSERELISRTDAGLRALSCEWRLRPRALALTMYLRLLRCDLFIHGIGGAKYDQITDDIIRRLFNVEPPSYACVTATERLPLPMFDATPADLDRIQRESRDRRFNPQRFISGAPSMEANGSLVGLLDRRRDAISESARLRRDEPGNRIARRAEFEAIHRANEALAAALSLDAPSRSVSRTDSGDDLGRLVRELESNQVASSREWFVGLFQIERLSRLADAVVKAVQA